MNPTLSLPVRTDCFGSRAHRATASILGAFLASVLLAGCGSDAPAAHNSSGGGPPGFRVVTANPAEEDIQENIRLVGNLTANERVEISSQIPGVISEIRFREGQPVSAGDILVLLDAGKLEAQIREAEADYELAHTNWERGKALREQAVISTEDFQQRANRYQTAEAVLLLRRSQLEDATIRAPFDGRVGSRMVSPGQYVTPGQPLTQLIDLDPIKAEFQVPERFLSRLAIGSPVEITVSAYPGQVFHGEVYFVAPEVDPLSRTVLVKAELPNSDARLKPGMFGNLELNLGVRNHAVVIPEIAVFFAGDQKFVYLVDADGKAELRPVQTGSRLPGRVEVRSGVGFDDRVITEGHQKLFPGAPLIESRTEAVVRGLDRPGPPE